MDKIPIYNTMGHRVFLMVRFIVMAEVNEAVEKITTETRAEAGAATSLNFERTPALALGVMSPAANPNKLIMITIVASPDRLITAMINAIKVVIHAIMVPKNIIFSSGIFLITKPAMVMPIIYMLTVGTARNEKIWSAIPICVIYQ